MPVDQVRIGDGPAISVEIGTVADDFVLPTRAEVLCVRSPLPFVSANRRRLRPRVFEIAMAIVVAFTLSACSSTNKFRNSAGVTVAYDAPRADVVEAYQEAFKTLPRVSYVLGRDSVLVGASTDPGFPADVMVRFLSENDLTVAVSSFEYDIIDRFDHYPMMLQLAATAALPDGVAMLRPQEVFPSDSVRCDVPPFPENAVVVAPELVGGMRSLQRQIFLPEATEKAGVQGTVFAGFVVSEKNRVVCVEILSGLPGGLNAQVRGGILASEFRAGTVDGVPTSMRVDLPWSFRVRKK